jgi:hypothetical protein
MSYSDLEDIETTSMRHGIYDHPAVQKQIGAIIRAVARGESPRLISQDVLDEEVDDRVRGWGDRHPTNKFWGESIVNLPDDKTGSTT